MQPCPEMHPLFNLRSVYPSIKLFLLYTEGTPRNNQSKFNSCGTFLVRVRRGYISWQDTLQPCPEMHPHQMILTVHMCLCKDSLNYFLDGSSYKGGAVSHYSHLNTSKQKGKCKSHDFIGIWTEKLKTKIENLNHIVELHFHKLR